MATSCLPKYPLFIFGILEPLSLVWAYITATVEPFSFYDAHAPHFSLRAFSGYMAEKSSASSPAAPFDPDKINPALFPPQARVMVAQLVNVYLLLAALALVCSWTKKASVTKGYLLAVALGDLGHVYTFYKGLGSAVFWNYEGWNDIVWAGVGVSLFLHVHRLLTVAGAFGAVKDVEAREGRSGAKKNA